MNTNIANILMENKMDKECENYARQCSHGGHCIGKIDTPVCKDFIQYIPKIRIEKQVWESTLNRSMKLQAENETLKDLLKECRRDLIMAEEDCGWDRSELIQQIDEVLNEKV